MVAQKERLGNIGRGMPGIKKPWVSESLRARWQKDPVYRETMVAALRGRVVSEETRGKMSQAKRGFHHTRESKRRMSRERGGVGVRAYPLLLRGGAIQEVALITGLSTTQVKNLRDDLRKHGQLSRPTKEQESEAKRKAHLGKPRVGHGRQYTDSQQKAITLAGRFLGAGLITEDLSFWNGLCGLYEKMGRKLPEDFADQIRLEVFLKARKQHAQSGNSNLLMRYHVLGSEVDERWLDSTLTTEEEFIVRNELGYQEDRNGFFRTDPEGNRWRPVDVVSGRLVVFDSGLFAQRQRERSSLGGK